MRMPSLGSRLRCSPLQRPLIANDQEFSFALPSHALTLLVPIETACTRKKLETIAHSKVSSGPGSFGTPK